MFDNSDYLQLVRRAQLGDKEGLNLLSGKARGDISVYIYRITFDFNLTEDLSQETLLEMVRAIKNLRDIRRFRTWLFQIASTKIKKHYRISGNKRIMNRTIIDAEKLTEHAEQKPDALGRLLKNEMSQAISRAMAKMKYNYRNILILRCFEQMSYPDIAYTMGCSSIEAQLLFFRAKHSLKKQLARQGYKKEHLLASLGIFAAITAAPFKGASASTSAVVPATMKVGTAAAVVGAMTTKTGIIASIIIAAVSGTMVYKSVAATNFHIISQEQSDNTRFKYPVAVAAAFNPQGGSWYGTSDANHVPVPVSLERWLTKPPLTNLTAVLIPEKGWISLRFSSHIADGPGDDIVIIEKCQFGEKADVFLADDNKNEAYIGTISVPMPLEHKPTFFACDISSLELPFTPTFIRILTTSPGGMENDDALPGFDLVSVRANLSE